MSFSRYKTFPIYMTAFMSLLSAEPNSNDESKDRIVLLEARLSELETRLAKVEKREFQNSDDVEMHIEELELRLTEAEQRAETAEQLVLKSASETKYGVTGKKNTTPEISTEGIDHRLLWTQGKQWDGIKPGIPMKKVIELLGPPLRSLDSLKPRVDEVFYYQTSFQSSSDSLRGKISFRNGEVLSVEKPNFE